MLRRLKTLRIAAAAVALAAATASFGQTQGGLAGELDQADKKLASDTQSCTPINLGEYVELLNKAAKNKQRADKLAKKGVPVDQTQVDADLAKAASLFHNAQAALVGQCIRAAQQAQGTQTSQAPTGPMRPAFALHNEERARVGAAPLRWNEQLAASAAAWAQQLAHTGQLVHAPREGRGIERENLSQGMVGWNVTQMMGNWVKEKRNFKIGIYPDVSMTGDWVDVSHYTQMIWPTTTDLGCGMAVGSGFNWLVCRYSPGGNKDGKPVIASRATDAIASLDPANPPRATAIEYWETRPVTQDNDLSHFAEALAKVGMIPKVDFIHPQPVIEIESKIATQLTREQLDARWAAVDAWQYIGDASWPLYENPNVELFGPNNWKPGVLPRPGSWVPAAPKDSMPDGYIDTKVTPPSLPESRPPPDKLEDPM